MYDMIVCDVDEKAYEGIALGLLYTAVSRGTTLGDEDGNGSAVYFKGTTFKPDRIKNLTCKTGTNEEFKKAIDRRVWVNYIEGRCHASISRVQSILKNQEQLITWMKSASYDYDHLYQRILQYKQHQTRIEF
jgi:hypothetical protein